MARNASSFSRMYIAEGFKEDCERLINRCTQVKKLSYEKFCNVWKDMDFACVFYGRHSGAEIAEFSEEALYVAKLFMFANTSNFEETVAGVFLVYALQNLQPFKGFASLRLINEDLAGINYIERTARSQRRYDVLYVLGSILIKGPCQYHVAQRERGLEFPIRKYLEENIISDLSAPPKGVFYKQNDSLNLLGELKDLTAKYSAAKMAINVSVFPDRYNQGIFKSHIVNVYLLGYSKLDRNLRYTNDEVPSTLETTLKEVMFGIKRDCGHVSDDKEEPKPSSPTRTSTVSSIKERAMKLSVNYMGHLIGLEERDSKKKTPSPKKPSPLKIKIKSPPPKKKKKRTNAPKPKLKIVYESSDEVASDISIHDSSDDVSVKSGTANGDSVLRESDKNIEIQVDALPVIITAPTNGEYEIEIIDHYNNPNHENAEKETVVEPSKVNKSGVSPKRKKSNDKKEKNNSDPIKVIENTESTGNNLKTNKTNNKTRRKKYKVEGKEDAVTEIKNAAAELADKNSKTHKINKKLYKIKNKIGGTEDPVKEGKNAVSTDKSPKTGKATNKTDRRKNKIEVGEDTVNKAGCKEMGDKSSSDDKLNNKINRTGNSIDKTDSAETHKSPDKVVRRKRKISNREDDTIETVNEYNIDHKRLHRKREKRDLKNAIITSSFRRMGLSEMVKIPKEKNCTVTKL